MPGERRNLRSNKDSASSTNGEKARTDSQSSSSKDKPVPARSASSKNKSTATRKTAASSKDSGNDKSKANGTAPVENGVNGAEDAEMSGDDVDRGTLPKDGEDEMTVVVPPPKSSKLSAEPEKDPEGDVAMDDSGKSEDVADSEKTVDPKVQAVSGKNL